MGSVPLRRSRWRRPWRGAVLAIVLGAGCSPGEPAIEAEEEAAVELAQSEEPESPEQATSEPRRFLPDQMRRATRPESFPHDAHVEISCLVCHTGVAGHGSHEELPCAECHLASALSSVTSLSPADCQACHHSPERGLACDACHEPPGTLTRAEVVHLSVWDTPRTRELVFQHADHEGVGCSGCHAAGPELAPPSCSTCHEEHHVETARCANCHVEEGAGAHDMRVHLTCSGAGCHNEPVVEAMADRRPVCLACHVAQEEHELGQECIDCHKMRGDALQLHAHGAAATARVWGLLSGDGR
jgi:hypothetical protein